MLRGLNAVSLDSKGRIVFPKRYRSCLEDTSGYLVATIHPEDVCLLLYPLKQWEAVESRLQALSSLNRTTRRMQRLLIGHATDLELDAQGRIAIPPLLRDYAQLDKRIMLVGQGQKCEIWSAQNWENERTQWLTDKLMQSDEVSKEFVELAF